MTVAEKVSRITFEEFLLWVVEQPGKYEFVEGEVFLMGGGTAAHSRVAVNVATALNRHLKGSSCRAYNSDMLVRVEAADVGYLPDVSVSCEDVGDALYLRSPKLIVEVLSASTEAMDRGRKFRDYRSILSLVEYVLIDPAARTIEVYRRSGEDWLLHGYGATEDVILESVELDLAASECFADV